MGTENDPMFEYPHKMQNIVYLFKSLQCHLRKEYETKLNIRGLNKGFFWINMSWIKKDSNSINNIILVGLMPADKNHQQK